MSLILVVDDDKDFLKMVKMLLEHSGHEVLTSTDAFDALDRLNNPSLDIDLVLSDANMPGSSGFDLVKTIRKSMPERKLPIALLTARRDKKDVYFGLECGADDYIVKPLDPDLFIAKVQSLIAQKPQIPVPHYNFHESPVRMIGKWEAVSEIIQVSERGVTVRGPVSATPNTKFKIKSDLFSLMGIEPPNLRVSSCRQDPNQSHTYIVEATFVGLVEAEQQKIRYWINSNSLAQKEKRSA